MSQPDTTGTEGDMTALLPCPFCGGLALPKSKSGLTFFVECQTSYCAVVGPERCAIDAEDAWNRRSEIVADLAARAEIERLKTLLNTPLTDDWFEGVRNEAAHQIERWGSKSDAGKTPLDWFWLVGFLAQKAATSQMSGDVGKSKHHTISTGAAMLNWFRAMTGEATSMRPGIEHPGGECDPT